jgi:hypothetical protein
MIVMPWKRMVSQCKIKAKQANEDIQERTDECTRRREQHTLLKGEILKLTVERRNLLTSSEQRKIEHQRNIINATNHGQKEAEKKYSKIEQEWLKKGRSWFLERNRLKLELEELNQTVLGTQTEKHRVVRDLDVSNAKQRRMARKAKEFRHLARTVQKKWEASTLEENSQLKVMEEQFDLWKKVSSARADEMERRLKDVEKHRTTIMSKWNVLQNEHWLLKIKWSDNAHKWRRHVNLFKAMRGWCSVVLGQKVGAKIALRCTHDYQRRALRDCMQRESSEQKILLQRKRMNELTTKIEAMEYERNEERESREQHAEARTKVLEQLAEDRLHALQNVREEKKMSEMELAMLENEMKELREKCIAIDAHQLTSIVLEQEVTMLRDDLEAARNEVGRSRMEIQRKNEEMNDVRLELENLV